MRPFQGLVHPGEGRLSLDIEEELSDPNGFTIALFSCLSNDLVAEAILELRAYLLRDDQRTWYLYGEFAADDCNRFKRPRLRNQILCQRVLNFHISVKQVSGPQTSLSTG